MTKKLYARKKISELTNLAPTTIDYYVKLGIAKPDTDSNGHKLYGDDDVVAISTYREKRA